MPASPETLPERFLTTDDAYDDYVNFEGDAKRRKREKDGFIDGRDYVPDFDYPKLDALYDAPSRGDLHATVKRKIYEGMLRLDVRAPSDDPRCDEYALYADYHRTQLKKVMLVEAASRMLTPGSSAAEQTARVEFTNLNRELYGEMDEGHVQGIMNTEYQRVTVFSPKDGRSVSIQLALSQYFEGCVMNEEVGERLPLDDEMLAELGEVIRERYAHILSVVPRTGEEEYYDAEQCREVMQTALNVAGLTEKGWLIVVDPSKSNPASSSQQKKISLPADTRRTAGQLCRLIIHEQEVHARRGQNGEESGLALLAMGTGDYADIEEGLGVLLECALAGDFDNQSYYRARDRYLTAAIAYGMDNGEPKDARHTFEILWRLIAVRLAQDGHIRAETEREAKLLAMTHIENAFRGTDFAAPGVIYSKLKIYYEGLMQNGAYFEAHAHNVPAALDRAMVGKYNHTSANESERITRILRSTH